MSTQAGPSLVARKYQEEILDAAKRGNVIAVLPTGSGKTFIATLLIRAAALNQSPSDEHKVVLFLAPTRPLVHQQAKFIASQIPLKVIAYVGDKAIEEWDASRWKTAFKSHHILVMTPDLLLKHVLTHAYWTMDRVSLIIFDEVHHARGNHAYAQISQHFIQKLPVTTRPKVFGMTASPVWNIKNPEVALQNLGELMQSTVIDVQEHDEELARHSHKPREFVYLHKSSFATDHPKVPSIRVPASSTYSNIPEINWGLLETRWHGVLEAAGVLAAEEFAHQHLVTATTKALAALSRDPLIQVNGSEERRVAAERTRSRLHALQADLAASSSALGKVVFDARTMISPKLQLRVDVLCENHILGFKCIIFVKEKYLAFALASFLNRVPDIDWVSAAVLVGHAGADGDAEGMDDKQQNRVVAEFRSNACNVLIATAVAEEGLDFQACHLVVRFDKMDNMKSYLQSRGRARHRDSVFVLLLPEHDTLALQEYEKLREAEAEMKAKYASAAATAAAATKLATECDNEDDEIAASDLAQRKPNFVVPATGATLTYEGAVGLLELLCASAPADQYGVVRAKYSTVQNGSQSFGCTLQLPPALPLPRNKLQFKCASPRVSKREAKNAVAFDAVKQLHALGIFDDHLLPMHLRKTPYGLDAYMREPIDVRDVPEYMEVDVLTPWKEITVGSKVWLHALSVEGKVAIGFLAATRIPEADFSAGGQLFSLKPIQEAVVEHPESLKLLEEYTLRLFQITGLAMQAFDAPFAFYLCNLRPDSRAADWAGMKSFLRSPYLDGWDTTSASGEAVLVFNRSRKGYIHLLQSADTGLTMADTPREQGGRPIDGEFKTFYDYFLDQFSKKQNTWAQQLTASLDPATPMFRLEQLPKLATNCYDISSTATGLQRLGERKSNVTWLVPKTFCLRVNLSLATVNAVRHLPQLTRRVVDLHRVRALNMPSIELNALIEATTLPHAIMGFDNQRLETLGDAFLKVGVSIFAFMAHPFKHEGQLSNMRIPSVSNRSLLARARLAELHQYLSGEPSTRSKWSPALSDVAVRGRIEMPRRSMQECVEALLGAAFASGGVEGALHLGRRLGLCFGTDAAPWSERYPSRTPTPSRLLFDELQGILGYRFSDETLVLEAVTHRTMQSVETASYERLEFLGDAILDLSVMHYLFKMFTKATCGQLSWARQRVVCNTTLAWLAVNKFNVQKLLLHNNIELSFAIRSAVDLLGSMTVEEIVRDGWKLDVPKPLSDVVETLFGAIFIDIGYDYEKTAAIICDAVREILELLSPDMPRDPSSRLMVFVGKMGCRKVKFRRCVDEDVGLGPKQHFATVSVHDLDVVLPTSGPSKGTAKLYAAEAALEVLQDDSSSSYIVHLCSCMDADPPALTVVDQPEPIAEKGNNATVSTMEEPVSDETEDGFNQLTQHEIAMAGRPPSESGAG